MTHRSDSGRWTTEPGGHGDDPRDIDDEMTDPEQARIDAQTRSITHDQPATGEQGISSDKPGIDPGGYPEKPTLPSEGEPATSDPSDSKTGEAGANSP